MSTSDDAQPEVTDGWLGRVLSERYRLGSLLGEGAMGRVYDAEHVMMRKRVAVKILHAELTRVPEVVSRFEREAMAAANIDHANVAAATDFGKLEDGSIYLVLEFVEGRSLRQELQPGPVSVPRALHIVRQMASALVAAHAIDIVHRDLKPENVLLVHKAHDPDFVKVLDFGIAKVPVSATAGPVSQPGAPITRVGMVFGTPEYMAPEQALGKEVDCRADIYALGVILYELLAGVRPFDEHHELGVLGQQLSRPVPRVADRAPGVDVPEPVEALAHRLLKREVSERPGSALEVVRALDGLLAQYAPELLTTTPGSIPGTASYPSLASYALSPDSAARAELEGAPSLSPRTLSSPEVAQGLVSEAVHSEASGAGLLPVSMPDDWLSPLRRQLPPRLRALPAALLLAVPAGALLFGLMVVVLTWAFAVTREPEAPEVAASASGAASSPVVTPSNSASAEELDAARRDGLDALTKLSALYPEDARVQSELARAHGLRKEYAKAVEVTERALDLSPELVSSPGVASTLWVAAQDDVSQDAAFALLQGKMGAKGADILYDLVTTQGVKRSVVNRAEKWLTTPEFQKNSSPALNIAVALRQAKTCQQRAGLLMRAKNVGDKRALVYLHRFATPTGCGGNGRRDCNPCLRSGDALKTTIEAIEQRVK
ncbi:MAG: protein kinase [Polyangiaceae bacterium]|nr:protein kinase [Polyangiaceae bacterium]MCW5792543.1 protein kinase [Polyangiaceae bacterium]